MDRLPFLRWKPLHLGLLLLVFAVIVGIVIGLIYRTADTIVVVVIVIIGVTMAGIINKTNDNIKEARNRHQPPGPDKILSFSLEKEMKEKNE